MTQKRINKYVYIWVVQQDCRQYGYGYEDLCASEKWREARDDIKAYRLNAPEYSYRIIRRREVNPEYSGMLASKIIGADTVALVNGA